MPEIEESSYVTRLDFTPRQDQDVISRVHLRVLEAGVSAALTRCLPIAERMQASYVRVVAQDGGFCEVALLSASPVAEGAEPERELRSAADRLAAQFGASERGFEFRDGPYGLTGVLETEPVEFMQGLWLRALYVRADDDPLYVEPVYDES
ncbi:hypothetical protein [Amycolatopsis panacis]|uniref:Uncharacterized protein n=1 Tax=Amycolatopsis panacis TaxID=2340917 RepID=A0A419I9W5_9PSEU|nr:hypothetical protein [Amycolatopsis panacis]RJQ89681.1 hypothetical protein D5S19_04340 [Amycolatopsis panacis]